MNKLKLLFLSFVLIACSSPINNTSPNSQPNPNVAECVVSDNSCIIRRFIDYQYNKICYYYNQGGIWCDDLEK